MLRRFVCLTSLWLSAFSAFAQTSVNVAAAVNGGVGTASSSYTSDFGPSKTIDGDRKGMDWASGAAWNDATADTFPDWVQVDFNGVQSISEIDVFTIQDNYAAPVDPTPAMTFTLYGITAFQVQYWNGSGWVDVPGGNVTGNNLVWRRFMFAPISTNRIQVLVNNALGNYSRIAEIEAWSAVSVTLNAPANNTVLAAPATVNLSATATDAAGALSKVEFYRDATLIATVTTPSSGTSSSGSYTASDPNVLAGAYSYTAKAYDSANPSVLASSSAVFVSVAAGAGSVNVAAAVNGGVGTASSSYTSDFGPSKTIDGDRKGMDWASGAAWNDATADTFPDWVQVDFNGVQSISEIDVFTIQDNYAAPVDPTPAMTFTLYGITAFQVQYWNGSGWVDVPGGNVTGNNLVWRRFMFAPISTNRIQVLVNNALGNYSRIAEIEAWSAIVPQVDYQIGGTVTASGAPLAGVAFATTNGGTCTLSDAAGQYACTVAQGWSGSVTSSLSGYSFAPASRSHSGVQANQAGQDFAAAMASGAPLVRVYYIDTDHLNTPRLIADQAGATIWRNDNAEPFGDSVPNNNPSGLGAFDFPLRFPGQYFDRETNLAYNFFRDHDPATGRYLQSDPIGLRGGLNMYAYVGGNPLSYTDPSGLLGEWGYAGGIVAVFGGAVTPSSPILGIALMVVGGGMIIYDFFDVKDWTQDFVDPIIEQQRKYQEPIDKLFPPKKPESACKP